MPGVTTRSACSRAQGSGGPLNAVPDDPRLGAGRPARDDRVEHPGVARRRARARRRCRSACPPRGFADVRAHGPRRGPDPGRPPRRAGGAVPARGAAACTSARSRSPTRSAARAGAAERGYAVVWCDGCPRFARRRQASAPRRVGRARGPRPPSRAPARRAPRTAARSRRSRAARPCSGRPRAPRAASSGPKYRGETCVSASIRTPASRRDLRRLARGRVHRLGGAVGLVRRRRSPRGRAGRRPPRARATTSDGAVSPVYTTVRPARGGPSTSSGVDRPPVGERHGLAALERAPLRARRERRARRRSRRRTVPAARPPPARSRRAGTPCATGNTSTR